MEYDDLDETFKDDTILHYVAHNTTYASPYEKYYYLVLPITDSSSIEVSVLSDDYLVVGIKDIPHTIVVSAGEMLATHPVDQNNKTHAFGYMYKNSKLAVNPNDPEFINQVYVDEYQKNKLLLGLINSHLYIIEVKNTRDATVYYNINIKFAHGSKIDNKNTCDMRPASESI